MDATAPHHGASRWSRVWSIAADEARSLLGRHRIGSALTRVLPTGSCHRLRAETLRLAGWNIERGVTMAQTPRLLGSGPLLARLHVGEETFVNAGGWWELNDAIDIGARVSLAPEVMLLTSTHRIGGSVRRAGDLTTGPITIGAGAWIGARVVILPGVTVGAGAIVAAGSVVRHPVAANSVVGGIPAKVIRELDIDHATDRRDSSTNPTS